MKWSHIRSGQEKHLHLSYTRSELWIINSEIPRTQIPQTGRERMLNNSRKLLVFCRNDEAWSKIFRKGLTFLKWRGMTKKRTQWHRKWRKMLFVIFEGDKLSGVELNLAKGKGGLFYIVVFETLLESNHPCWIQREITTYTGDELLRFYCILYYVYQFIFKIFFVIVGKYYWITKLLINKCTTFTKSYFNYASHFFKISGFLLNNFKQLL